VALSLRRDDNSSERPDELAAEAQMTVEAGIDGARYAIYWAPPDGSPLAEIGNSWLGRDAAADYPRPRPAIPGFDDATLAAATAEPRRYGLHATLKAPFRLAEGMSAAALAEELAIFAAGRERASVPRLQVARIGQFLALVPEGPASSVDALASACVERFDAYRAPHRPEEYLRRSAAGLSPRQAAHLARWGYPYVMEEYRFHVTLTGRIERAMSDRLAPELARVFAPVTSSPFEITEIALFVEPDRGAPFRLARRFGLGSPRAARPGMG
jgi:putative phosphonate metabolism protein